MWWLARRPHCLHWRRWITTPRDYTDQPVCCLLNVIGCGRDNNPFAVALAEFGAQCRTPETCQDALYFSPLFTLSSSSVEMVKEKGEGVNDGDLRAFPPIFSELFRPLVPSATCSHVYSLCTKKKKLGGWGERHRFVWISQYLLWPNLLDNWWVNRVVWTSPIPLPLSMMYSCYQSVVGFSHQSVLNSYYQSVVSFSYQSVANLCSVLGYYYQSAVNFCYQVMVKLYIRHQNVQDSLYH